VKLIIDRYGLLLIPILCFISFSTLFLTVYPIPWPDEADLGDPAFQLTTKGTLSSSLVLGQEKHVSWVPPGYAYSLSVFFFFFGYGLEQQRLFSLLFGCGILTLAYAITLHITDNKRSAFITSLLILADPFFLRYAKIGRMESLTVFLVLLAVYALVSFFKHPSSARLLLVGILVACAGFVHPFGFLVLLAIVPSLFLWHRQMLSLKGAVVLIFPSLISLAVWLCSGLAHFETFKVQLGWQWQRMVGKDIFVQVETFFNSYRFIPLILLVQVGSISAAIIGRMPTYSLSSAKFCGACALIFFVVALRTAEPQHALYFLPLCAILASLFLSSPSKKSITPTVDIRRVIIGLFVLNGLLHAGYFAWQYGFQQPHETSYTTLAALTRAHLGDAQSIVLHGYPELSWSLKPVAPEVRIIEPPFFTPRLLEEAMARIDHIVMTRGSRVQEDERELEENMRQYQQALASISKKASLIAEVGTKVDWAYSARVYKILSKADSIHLQSNRR
jgi:hypothetical protein